MQRLNKIQYFQPILGKTECFKTGTDEEVAKELISLAGEDIPVAYGDTICGNDFYEGNRQYYVYVNCNGSTTVTYL